MKFVALFAIVRKLAPAMYIIAAAYQYGQSKYGDGSWRLYTSSEHLEKASNDMSAWASGDRKVTHLADAALHLMFAVVVAVTAEKAKPAYEKEEVKDETVAE